MCAGDRAPCLVLNGPKQGDGNAQCLRRAECRDAETQRRVRQRRRRVAVQDAPDAELAERLKESWAEYEIAGAWLERSAKWRQANELGGSVGQSVTRQSKLSAARRSAARPAYFWSLKPINSKPDRVQTPRFETSAPQVSRRRIARPRFQSSAGPLAQLDHIMTAAGTTAASPYRHGHQ